MPPVNSGLANCAIGKGIFYSALNQLACSGGTPTMGTCGVSPSVAGTKLEGTITAGSGTLTACTMNFGQTLSAAPRCNATGSIGAVWITAITTTAVTFTGASLTSSKIYYNCWNAF